MTQAEKYIRAIHNPLKKQYAQRYWNFINLTETLPTIGPDRGELTAMAAQAVRLELNEIKAGSAVPELLKASKDLLAWLREFHADEPLFSSEPNHANVTVSALESAIAKTEER